MPLQLFITLSWTVVIIYLAATIANAHGLLFENDRIEKTGYLIAGAGLAMHSMLIAYWWHEVGHGPYMAPNEVLSSDAWVVMASFFIFLRIYPRIKVVGLLAFPAAFLLLGLSMLYNPGLRTLPTTFHSIWLIIHIGLYKISLATLVIAFAFSLFILLKQNREYAWLRKLPSLEVLDIYCYRFAGFGFVFWTIGMLAGSIWANQSWGRFWGWDPTETWSLITCLLFAAYLHLRRFFGWDGSKAAAFYILCFVISLVSLFGMATISGSLHSEYFK